MTAALLTIYLAVLGGMAPPREEDIEPPPAATAPAVGHPAPLVAEIVAMPESSTPEASASAASAAPAALAPGNPAPPAGEGAAAALVNPVSQAAGAAGGPSAPAPPSSTSPTSEAGGEPSAPASSPDSPPPMPAEQSGSGSPATHDGASAGTTGAKLLVVDLREVFSSPAHWQARDWTLFTIEVAAVVGVGVADESLQRDATRRQSTTADKLARDFRDLGAIGSAGVLGGFFLDGLITHDQDAQATALDGLFASGIAAGLISPVLKVAVGRSRPNSHHGAYDFHPFSFHNSNTSFPAGESTQAFTMASVISAHYPSWWVETISYTTAALTALGRVRQNGHWASDSLVGALIGYHVGRAVVHINQRLRGRIAFAPLVGPGGERGLSVTADF